MQRTIDKNFITNVPLKGAWGSSYTLLEGNPLKPGDHDLIVERAYLDVGEPVPDGGWNVLGGNSMSSSIARVCHRIDILEKR